MATSTAWSSVKCVRRVTTDDYARRYRDRLLLPAPEGADWQRDDIEYAISSFADDMNPELYSLLADGRTDFLRSHATFHADMLHALDILEKML